MKDNTISKIALIFYGVLLVLSATLMTMPGDNILWFGVMAVVAIIPVRVGPRSYRIIGTIAIVIAIGLMAMDYYRGVQWRERRNHSEYKQMENTSPMPKSEPDKKAQ